MTTKTDRAQRLKAFVTCFNIAYPDWEINGDATKALTTDHVEYGSLSSNWGKCGPRRNGRIYFGLNHTWWENHDTPARLGLLIHELGHVKHTNHRPAFWEQLVRIRNRLYKQTNEVADVLAVQTINWDDVDAWLVEDPKVHTVDNRIENAYERRLKLASAFDYPKDEIEPFAAIKRKSYWKQDRSNTYESTPISDIEYDAHTLDELRDWFNNTKTRTGVHMERGRYIIDHPVAIKTNSGYRVVEGSPRVELQRYLRQTETIDLQIVDHEEFNHD